MREYRANLAAINAEFEAGKQRISQYAGSRGYDDELKALAERRAARLAPLRESCAARFNVILHGMRDAVDNRPITPPADEQLRLVQVLSMRDPETISTEELRAAAKACENCNSALGVLEDIARKSGRILYADRGLSSDAVQKAIDGLTQNAQTLLRMDSVGDRAAHATSFNWAAFAIDKDFADEKDCICTMSGVSAYDAFAEAVNG